MGINKVEDPRTGDEIIILKGTVDGVYLNEIKPEQRKTYGDWTPTHRINLVVDKIKVAAGMTDKEEVSAKDKADNYHTLTKGVKVSITVTENGEYKGTPNYQCLAKDILVTDASGAQAANTPPPKSEGGSSFTKKDMSGVHVGHSINGAMNLLGDNPADNAELIKTAKQIHDITQEVKDIYGKANPTFSEYDVGAASGNAVLNAAKLSAEIGDVKDWALSLLDEVVPAVLAHVKPAKTEKAEAKKPAPKKAAPKKAAKSEPQESENPNPEAASLADMDDDSDIPF